MSKEYGNGDIKRLSEIEKVRKKPAVIFGSSTLEGCIHSVFEVISNSIDESRAGYGDEIWVTVHSDNSWTVKDLGRGIPMAMNKKEKMMNYELVFCTLYAGGKYDEDSDAYKYSLGTNGLGVTATNFASKWFKVETKRDGKIYTVGFEQGLEKEKYKEVVDKDKNQKTGTTISWLPDLEIFDDINIPQDRMINTLKTQAIVNKGLTLHFTDERDGFSEDYYYKDGVQEYVKGLIKKKITEEPIYIDFEGRGRDRADRKDYSVKGEILLVFDKIVSISEYYHNSSYLKNGGSPKEAKEAALLEFFEKEVKKKDYKNKIEYSDIGESLIFISNTFSTHTDYEGQTKYAIHNRFIEDIMKEQIIEALKKWAKDDSEGYDAVCEEIIANAESRIKANELKDVMKGGITGKIKNLSDRIKKYIDCRSKDNNVAEFIIAEGDSAIGSLKSARHGEFQALLPIRGKSLNVYKANYKQLFDNEEIKNIMKIVGTGVETEESKKETKTKQGKKDVKTKESKKKNALPEFNINNRRFSKIIFATDEDDDAYHIRSLLICIFWKLTPELIKQGYVYYLRTPLFEIQVLSGNEKGKMLYAFTDEERDKISKQYDDKVKCSRNKGLGELQADTLNIFMTPGTRKLIRITMNDVKKAEKNLELWMGDDAEPRKKYMTEHGNEYIIEE